MVRDYDIILYGASGFTGRLVAEYLQKVYGNGEDLVWAIAGRNEDKLREIANAIDAPDTPIVVADSRDSNALASMVASASVVCTTVGPYALYGSELVAACVAAGTHYCDLTGEVPWMRDMIRRHESDARDSGARIVHTCGFDSIPSDLGTLFLQEAMLAEHGVPAKQVKLMVDRFSGAFSGGTVASMINIMETAGKDRKVREVVADPYALLPEGAPRGPDGNDQTSALYDDDFQRWTLPFVMAGINTRVVRRSNALLDFAWGENFSYSESMLAPARQGAVTSKLAGLAMTAGTASLAIAPLRAIARRFLPAPGEGPSKEQREKGFFDIYLYGVHPTDRSADMVARVTGDRDPGYGSTSKMLAEAAICLARDDLDCEGGFWTPASAMGSVLIQRLQESAGLTFERVADVP
nr:saccharopine dehydrogenase NADP-binding domain-containing protein [Halioglobus sp. HI00S01]